MLLYLLLALFIETTAHIGFGNGKAANVNLFDGLGTDDREI